MTPLVGRSTKKNEGDGGLSGVTRGYTRTHRTVRVEENPCDSLCDRKVTVISRLDNGSGRRSTRRPKDRVLLRHCRKTTIVTSKGVFSVRNTLLLTSPHILVTLKVCEETTGEKTGFLIPLFSTVKPRTLTHLT